MNAGWRGVKKNLPNEISNSPDNDFGRFLVERYEELRAEITSPKRAIAIPEGLALFLRRGMSAWMLAWACCTQAKPIITSKPQEKNIENRSPSRELNAEVVAVLVNMVLINQMGQEHEYGGE